MIRIAVTSIFVNDQDKALAFYTDVLGFEQKQDIPLGGGVRWLTVAAPSEPEGVELVLEPNGHAIAKAYQEGLYQQGIPATAFATDDIEGDYDRMRAHGVTFVQPPTAQGPVTHAVFDDTCGNFIGLLQTG